MDLFADPQISGSTLISNLASLPATVERFQNRSREDGFSNENPNIVDADQLEPTSGRKNWKIRHHKPLKRKLKTYKNGFKAIV
jgi:hypothetical protein